MKKKISAKERSRRREQSERWFRKEHPETGQMWKNINSTIAKEFSDRVEKAT